MQNKAQAIKQAFENRAQFFAQQICTKGKNAGFPRGAGDSQVRKILKHATDAACVFIAGAIEPRDIEKITNIKSCMRLSEAIDFAARRDVAAYDKGSAVCFAMIALAKQGEVKFSELRFLMGGRGNDDTEHIKGVSRSKILRHLQGEDEGSVPSKTSRTVGSGGFLNALGITQKTGKNSFAILQPNHPLIVAYGMQLENMTDGELILTEK